MTGSTACLLVSPFSVRRGRLGPLLARALSRIRSDLVAAGTIAIPDDGPSDALIDAAGKPVGGLDAAAWRPWVRRALAPGAGPAVALVFSGPDASREVRALLGDFGTTGTDASLRGLFGVLESDGSGRVAWCDPVAFAADSDAALQALARVASGSSGRVPAALAERTLVLVKPDNFRHGGGRPGQVLDLFCRTGLDLVGARLVRFSVRQALEFYGPVREALRSRLGEFAGTTAARELASGALGLEADAEVVAALGRVLGPAYGEQRFRNLVRFMTGRVPGEGDEAAPGSERTLALVFEGADAVARMRAVLGPTDPTKAPPGTVRREFGTSILDNAAHASDSVENAAREIAIVDPWAADPGAWAAGAAG